MGNALFNDGGKWAWDLLTGKRKVSAADNAYLENNGPIKKAFKTILELLGNKYSGD